jgi:hypothetical protein
MDRTTSAKERASAARTNRERRREPVKGVSDWGMKELSI